MNSLAATQLLQVLFRFNFLRVINIIFPNNRFVFLAVANRFVAEYGVVRLSIGEAIRKVLNFQSYTELARQINLHLKAGTTVPDELAVQALEVALLDMQCQTRG